MAARYVLQKPLEQVRALVEDCVSAGVLAAVDGHRPDEISRKLLEHREQKFRLSYLLGNLSATGEDEEDDEEGDSLDEGAEEIGIYDGLSPELPLRLSEFVAEIAEMAEVSRDELAKELGVSPADVAGEDRDAFEELLEDRLREHDRFHDLVDRIMEDVAARFAVLGDGRLEARPDDWPIAFAFDERIEIVELAVRFTFPMIDRERGGADVLSEKRGSTIFSPVV